jgi:hypothetical protein
MKRRKFLEYGAIGSTSFLVNLGLFKNKQTYASLSTTMSNKRLYDWIFLYWMPYDNNLSRFGNPILQMLTKGVQSDNILVVVESDFSGAKQLSRNVIAKGKIDTQNLETANSGSEEAFAEYLSWAKSQFQAEKWAIVFLGHGGRLDEVSPDDNPFPGSASPAKWMNIQKISDIIANFNREVDDRVELFFFQNCNKGTLEAHYTVRDTAKYTLSSQLLLGAPNYYYEPLFKFLGRHPQMNGGQLAEKVMEFERSDMYSSYTVTNNRAVRHLPEKINPLIDSILSSDVKAVKVSEINSYSYMEDRLVDVIAFFQKLTQQAGADVNKVNEFTEFFTHSMIHRLQHNNKKKLLKQNQNLSGLGMFLPKSRQEIAKYRYLPIFSNLRLVELFDAILLN